MDLVERLNQEIEKIRRILHNSHVEYEAKNKYLNEYRSLLEDLRYDIEKNREEEEASNG